MVTTFIAITILACFLVPFSKDSTKAWVAIAAILASAVISTSLVWKCIAGIPIEIIYNGSYITGPVALRADALSAWFVLIINFIFVTGSIYGAFYMKSYLDQKNNTSLHFISFIITHASLVALCFIQNSIIFLAVWELMVLSAFIGVIFEHYKSATIKAGINYLIQSHVSIIFLILGFIWVALKTGTYDFNGLTQFSAINPQGFSFALFIFFFIGFAFKAGFIPFHSWLHYAHPAAPAHISGIMSGVIIKIGIFGILRMLLLIKLNYTAVAYIILTVSVLSGLYGVMLAIIQHNLKKLLAYHSIENIGIIGIGIGLGCMGLGIENHTLAFLGFAGALLHVWNHALFKSLLFFTAGNVYKAYHTIDIEKLGGVVKKMPHTSLLFMLAAMAICGLPPFNGFISEFLIYNGLYNWLHDAGLSSLIAVIFSILALVLIGGLAMLCFTKAFGIVFLGNNRHQPPHDTKEAPAHQLIPLYLILCIMLLIGIFPQWFLKILYGPVSLFSRQVITEHQAIPEELPSMLGNINLAVLVFITLVASLFLLRKWVIHTKPIAVETTWGCGYLASSPKIQYTASSFVRSYSKLFRFVLLIFQKEKNIEGIIPEKAYYETHPYDRIEKNWIDYPIRTIKSFLSRFLFLQNGRLQVYILYGILFVILTIGIPFIYQNIQILIEFFKQL